MNILVIEDSDIKFSHLIKFLLETYEDVKVKRTHSYQSGVESLVYGNFDVVILDMTLPASDVKDSYLDNEMFTFGGEFVLQEMERLEIIVRTIVLTQYSTFIRDNAEVPFDQLKEEMLGGFPNIVCGFVRLDIDSVVWKQELKYLIA